MKKIVILLAAIGLSLIFLGVEMKAQSFFRIVASERSVSETSLGVRHEKIIGEINYNGTVSKQVINYIAVNPQKTDVKVITGDGFKPILWGMEGLPTIINSINQNTPYTVIGGVNGDFYEINTTGMQTGTYIKDFKVWGKRNQRGAVGFNDDGSVVWGKPQFAGLVISVYNQNNELKANYNVSGINTLPSGNQISVFFPDSLDTLNNEIPKVVLEAKEFKLDGGKTTYYGSGTVIESTTNEVSASSDKIILVGNALANGLENGDFVEINEKVTGPFADARFVMATETMLVERGIANENITSGASYNARAPRTAVAEKTDGTVFFVVVDGRQSTAFMDGVTLQEMAQIMKYFDARTAYNLDGGGSATISLYNEEDQRYNILNSPSDMRIRAISNALFFVTGNHLPRAIDISQNPNRTKLSTPTNLKITDGTLTFDAVSNAKGYYIISNGVFHYSETNTYQLNKRAGVYEITVRARGDATYATSDSSQIVSYMVVPKDVQSILDLIKGYIENR